MQHDPVTVLSKPSNLHDAVQKSQATIYLSTGRKMENDSMKNVQT